MGLVLLTERHKDQIAGVLSCYDRVLVFGTLPTLCFAEGMTSYLYAHKIRLLDYPRFAEPYRNELRENAERLAAENLLLPGYANVVDRFASIPLMLGEPALVLWLLIIGAKDQPLRAAA
jgi:hypothetical protein